MNPYTSDLANLSEWLDKTETGPKNVSEKHTVLSPRELEKLGNQTIEGQEKKTGSGPKNKTNEDQNLNLSTKSVPEENQATEADSPAFWEKVEQSRKNDTNHTAEVMNISKPGSQDANTNDIWTASQETVFIEPRPNDFPMVIVGRTAYMERQYQLSQSKDSTPIHGYNVTDTYGRRLAINTECHGKLCLNYTHISASYRQGRPIGWLSPDANFDEMVHAPKWD